MFKDLLKIVAPLCSDEQILYEHESEKLFGYQLKLVIMSLAKANLFLKHISATRQFKVLHINLNTITEKVSKIHQEKTIKKQFKENISVQAKNKMK